MATFDGSVIIGRPPSVVFDVVGTHLFETQPKWEDGIVAIRPVTGGPMGVGSKAVMERLDLGVWRHETDYRCVVFDQDRLVVMHNDSAGTHVVFRLSVAPAGAGETRLRFRLEVQLTGAQRIFEPLARMVLGPARRKTMEDIKEYVETATAADGFEPAAGTAGPAAGLPMPELPGVSHRWIDVRGLRMHIAEAGSGEPLILLHGFPQHWWEWHGAIPRLAGHYRVIAVDQRGFGWTDAPGDGYNARTLVQDIAGLMGELNIRRARFLTHDWGAVVAQLLAMDRPDLVEALVVTGAPDVHIKPNARLLRVFPKLWHVFAIAAPGIGPRLAGNRKLMRHLFTAFDPAGGVSEADIQLYRAAMAQPGRAAAGSALYRTMLVPAFMAIIAGAFAKRDLPVRTLVIVGAAEPSGTLQGMGHYPGRGGNITTEILPGEGHFLVDHVPGLIAEKALRFFA